MPAQGALTTAIGVGAGLLGSAALYRGYSFLLVDPYPEYWAANWYELDDVYIAYDDGYYLCNRNYPQVQLAVIVEL